MNRCSSGTRPRRRLARRTTRALGALAPALLVCAFVTGLAFAAPRFAAPYAFFDAGAFPLAFGCADLDHDGRLDVVTANNTTVDAVAVVLGTAGGFAPALAFDVANAPGRLALADFDGDGWADLALAGNYFPGIVVARGGPGGTFAAGAPAADLPGAGALLAADLDRDGREDLVVLQRPARCAAVLRGRGDGTFEAAVTFPTLGMPEAGVIADVNRDGAPDLVVTLPDSGSVGVLAGDGAGGFAPVVQYAIGMAGGPVVATDLDGDGWADLLAGTGNWPYALAVLRGTGAGAFAPSVNRATSQPVAWIVAQDVDADGHVDVIAGGGTFRGHGDGTLEAPITTHVPYGGLGAVAYDADGDGRTDVLTVGGSIALYAGNGDGTFGTYAGSPTGGDWPSASALGDLDGDGLLDAALSLTSGSAGVMRGQGDGSFAAPVRYAMGSWSYPSAVAIGDVDGNGAADVLVANRDSNNVSLLRGNGAGGFLPRVNYPAGVSPRSVAIGDVNGDGRQDLLAANSGSNSLTVLTGNADGSFMVRPPYPMGTGPVSVAAGLLDTDARADVVVANQFASTVSVSLGRAFTVRRDYATAAYPVAVAIGDLDGDHVADLVVACSGNAPSPSGLTILRGVGDGTFTGRHDVITTFMMPSAVALADLDGDGRLDVVAGGSGAVAVYPGNGDGTLGVPMRYGCGGSIVSLAVGDLDRDGLPDLVATTSFTTDPRLWWYRQLPPEAPTAIDVALERSDAAADHATLVWYAAGGAGMGATLERSAGGDAWRALGSLTADGTGRWTYVDRDVVPGGRYGYRLAIAHGGATEVRGETWLAIPASARFALRGLQPNPATSRPAVAFTLPDARPTRLEVFDVRGARLVALEVGALGAGAHVVSLPPARALPPGVYLVRLTRAGAVLSARGTVIR